MEFRFSIIWRIYRENTDISAQRVTHCHAVPTLSMNRKPRTKLTKWNMMSAFEKECILDEFWCDYFRKYPEMGSSSELNIMRQQFQSSGRIKIPLPNRNDA